MPLRKVDQGTAALLFVMGAILVGCNAEKSLDSERLQPNFLFILVDDQGWNGTSVEMIEGDSLSRSDFFETPHLEALADSGMVFSQAYAAAPVCAPSRYSIQFGKTPARLSVVRVGMNTDHIQHEALLSIPKALAGVDSNYVAGHFGKWGMGSHPSILGYAHSDGPNQNKAGGFVNDRSQWTVEPKEDPKRIGELTRSALEFMAEANASNRPFYLQVSHYAVHASIQATPGNLETFESKGAGVRHMDTGFAAMTADLDAGLGTLMRGLDSLGLRDNTYIFYMSDNGCVPNIPGAKPYTRSLNYPLSRGKWDAMEGGIRVPLVVSGPGIAKGAYCDQPVSGCDILPTISHLAGRFIGGDSTLDGGSFHGLLFEEEEATVTRLTDGLVFHVPYRNGIALKRPHSAIRKGDFKLLKFQDTGETYLYDLSTDLGETTDRTAQLSRTSDALERQLDAYLHSVKAPKWAEGITWKKHPLESFNSRH